jgi:hypothetical protein
MTHDKVGPKQQRLKELAAGKRKRRRRPPEPSSTPSEVADRMATLGNLKAAVQAPSKGKKS